MRAAAAMALIAACVAAVPLASAQDDPVSRVRFDEILQVPVSSLQLSQPLAVHSDLHTGELFVADVRRNAIAIFDASGLFRFGIPGGQVFTSPQDVAVWPDGHILVLAYTDRGRSLIRMDFDGRHPEPFPIHGIPASAEEPWLTSIALSADGERVYLLDEKNNRLWIANGTGNVVGNADLAEGYTPKEKREQILERVDVYGNTVLVPLPMAGIVRMFDLDGERTGFAGRKGGASCETGFPVAAALTEDGNVLILDQQRALMMLWRPSDNRCLGEISGIGGAPGRLYRPADLALDPSGNAFVGQGFEGRVQRFRGVAPAEGAFEAAKLRE
jgi:DNA-binding beta-propeller fold protein YncE